MIWLIVFLFVALAVLVGGAWLLVREPRDQAAALDHHFDAIDPTLEIHHETLRDLRPADLGPVHPRADGPPGSPPGDETAGGAPVVEAGAPLVRGADRGGVADAPDRRLTPAQRRRAVHKGRIPRTSPAVGLPVPAAGVARLPGPDSNQRSALHLGETGELIRAGEHHDLPSPANQKGPDSAQESGTARRAGEHHERLPAPLTIYDPERRRLMPVFGSLVESVAWEARRAEDEHWLGAQLDEFEEWWAAPGRWELVA